MGADKTTRADRVSTGPQCGMSEAAEECATFECATDKGKGKEIPSSVDRMQSYGRTVLESALNNLPAFRAQNDQKATENIGTSSPYQAHQALYGLQKPCNGELFASSSRTFKPANDSNGHDTQFDAFAKGSGTGELVHLGHIIAQPAQPAKLLQQSNIDGFDVVSLLSQPESPETPAQSDHYDLSPVETVRLQEGLLRSEPGWPFWEQLLNFNAEFLVRPERFIAECEAHLGTSDFEEARSIWLNQWTEVLTSYTNEVWGDLGPLAQAAKIEIAKLDQDKANGCPSIQALERLRLVLAHVRGH
ncbi:hypothetical protein E4U43_001514 [Claviceps pusilla]|uniref:Uncharacterized protein n=1 Tax=Claviceps pusilla TaxID=123648 RepID=A0A9P7NJG5_9HYPO|nr:hypothetical protein E4U43_001514 [Claviceps pusilla]